MMVRTKGGGVISSYLCGERFSKFQKDYSDQVIFELKFCFIVDRRHDHD